VLGDLGSRFRVDFAGMTTSVCVKKKGVIPAKAQGCPGKIGFSATNIDAKLKDA
jgi:hypothetical protein